MERRYWHHFSSLNFPAQAASALSWKDNSWVAKGQQIEKLSQQYEEKYHKVPLLLAISLELSEPPENSDLQEMSSTR